MSKIFSITVITVMFLLAFMAIKTNVHAECRHNGQTFETGQTREDGRTCQSDGTWQ